MIEKYLNNRFIILYILPFVIGSLTILSFQPFNFTILNFFIFPLFFYLLIYIKKKTKTVYRKKPFKKNFFIFGLTFGFGFYFCGISWISNSLTFDENFKILIPFTMIFIPLFFKFICWYYNIFNWSLFKIKFFFIVNFFSQFSLLRLFKSLHTHWISMEFMGL